MLVRWFDKPVCTEGFVHGRSSVTSQVTQRLGEEPAEVKNWRADAAPLALVAPLASVRNLQSTALAPLDLSLSHGANLRDNRGRALAFHERQRNHLASP